MLQEAERQCIVFSGQYRTFDQTWPALCEFIKHNNLDVYCHLWTDDDEEESQRQYNMVVEKLKPKRIVHEKLTPQLQSLFDGIEHRIRFNNPKGPNSDKLAGNASMNYSRKSAFDLIADEYDVLVYCRYDIGFREMFKFWNVSTVDTPMEESYNLISDIFSIMPFKMAKAYFLFDEYEHLHSTPFEPEFINYLKYIKYPDGDIEIHDKTRWCPHMMLLRNLYLTKTPFNKSNIPVYLQR